MKIERVKKWQAGLILFVFLFSFFSAQTANAGVGDFLLKAIGFGGMSAADKATIQGKITALEAQIAAYETAPAVAVKDVAVAKATIESLKLQLEEQRKLLAQANKKWAWDDFVRELGDQLSKGAEVAFWAASKSVLDKLAFDAAELVKTGNRGQGSLLLAEDPGEYITNMADNAAGKFLERLGKDGFIQFNLCEPNFAAKMKIGLGLVNLYEPNSPKCTFTKMINSWDEELSNPDFLTKFQDMFEPTSSDLGIALSLQANILQTTKEEKENKAQEVLANEGWLDVRDIAGRLKGQKTIQSMKNEQERVVAIQAGQATTFTGTNTLVSALNIFLNHLGINLFDNLMRSLNVSPTSFPYSGNYGGFADYEASPQNGGTVGAESQFRKILEPNFSTRGDYNILAELTACSDPQKAGPTNCVIDEKFRQAIINRLTVGEAIEQGYLNGNASFGYLANGLEPNYQEGYPYRSLPILRKFRIIPVGWEVAAQTLKESGRALTLKQVVDCFSNTDNTNETCVGLYGLVDPTWVLKAPLNYCKKEGPGSEIVSSQVSDSSISLLRNDNYCADEQSCVKENDNGSCLYYGYCSEEKRTWQFNSDSCDPVYNTCQSFYKNNQPVSYLKNTLSYCDAGGAGCTEYSRAYNYDTQVWNPGGDKIWFNSQATTCDDEDEGCRQLIRAKAGLGVNLIKDDSFENQDSAYWGSTINFFNIDSLDGVISAQAGSDNASLVKYVDVGKNTEGGQYVWSFYAKNCSGATYSLSVDRVNDTCIDGVCGQTINYDGDWQRYSIAYNFKLDNPEHQLRLAFQFPAGNDACLVDAWQLEEDTGATTYSAYGSKGVIYEKLLPNYLSSLCDDTALCDKYAQFCQASEVGCELYTSQTDDSAIPAKTTAKDQCSSSCVGYDSYIQQASAFDSLTPAYFIPSTANFCTAEAVGCDEFTNLDKVSSGGEAREYYSYFKQCIKPDITQCADFYTWEGSSESGYQIKNFSLKADATGAPALSNAGTYENRTCVSKTDYDPINNPLCREFFDKAGKAHYAFSIYTISCSDNCHPFRRTDLNYDDGLAETECSGADKHWDSANNSCVVCKNGGTWDNGQGACIYMAIPNEGKTCSAAQVGCRSYTGNKGANYQVLGQWNFDAGLDNWEGNNSNIEKSQVSLNTGGSSLFVKDGAFQAFYPIGTAVNTNSAYVLNFLAKSDNGSAINFSFVDIDGNVAYFNALPSGVQPQNITLGSEWKLYTVNIDLSNSRLSHSVGADEVLEVVGSGAFYIDNIKLTEVIDRYYLIKNSWSTPDSCNQDLDGNVFPLYALGCDHYQDRNKNDLYFRSFSGLCSESAVGCELLIDTHNSTSYRSATANGVAVPEDNYIYAVYDAEKECNSADKGCELMGKKYSYGSEYLYSNVYMLNNPDLYNNILCSSDEVGCQAWASDNGTTYFKDPGNMTCNWHDNKWWKTKAKRCGKTGNICLNNDDCIKGITCQTEEVEVACPADTTKTLGYGGDGNEVYQPAADSNGQNWAGLCPSNQSGCTEYIDPISQFSANLVDNPICKTIGGVACAGWNSNRQDLSLAGNTLYVFGTSTASQIQGAGLKILGEDNKFTAVNAVKAKEGNNLFLTADSGIYDLSRGVSSGEVSVRKAIVEYRLDSDIDKKACTEVNFSKNCIAFNERSASTQDKLTSLTNDYDGNGIKDSNAIIKVAPNRVCDKWLACKSYVKDESGNNICYDIGLCQASDLKGNCSSWAVSDAAPVSLIYDGSNAGALANLSGYSKVGIAKFSSSNLYNIPSSLYNLGEMKQVGEVANLVNGNFEFSGTNGYPLGWVYELGGGLTQTSTIDTSGATTTTTAWNSNIFAVIDSPYTIQSSNLCFKIDNLNNCQSYAPEGNGILRLGSGFTADSEPFEVGKATDYVVSGYLNTKNMSAGTAKLQILNDSDSVLVESTLNAGSSGWIFKVAKFKTTSTLIKVRLLTEEGSKGAVYFDDIKVKPALEAKENWNIPQSCRLYPENSSLSCDYYDDSGIRKKGWLGYCLEYDRAPGDPNSCILWYPVDRVKGDGLNEEGAGYSGAYPVYYCVKDFQDGVDEYVIDLKNGGFKCDNLQEGLHTVSQNLAALGVFDTASIKNLFNQNLIIGAKLEGGVASGNDQCAQVAGDNYTPSNNYLDQTVSLQTTVATVNPGHDTGPYYSFASNGNDITSLQCSYYQTPCYQQGATFSRLRIYVKRYGCKSLVQTVTPTGTNQAWSSRVYSGTNYTIPCNTNHVNSSLPINLNICSYNTKASPFGSVNYPFPANNPYEWDSNDKIDNNQPLYYGYAGSAYVATSNMGELQSVDNLKKIFSRSYDAWTWDGSHYIRDGALNWPAQNEEDKICIGVRGDDYCAIPPIISNVKVNSIVSGNLSVIKNSFINLTFNSSVDDEQQPLVMYAIDWGDGDKTIVSGVEIYDRPNVDNPHSLYHLYDYWDLKTKSARGIGNISCGISNGIGYCSIKPKVQIKDNWGWCSGGVKDTCTIWSSFGGAIVVREK